MSLLRRRMYGNNVVYSPIVAPLLFDPSAQPVNLIMLFTNYNDNSKDYAYIVKDTVNTLTLAGSAGVTYYYGYTRGGIDYTFLVTNATNPFQAGDTKRFVIVIGIGTTQIAPSAAEWVIFGSRVVTIGGTVVGNIKWIHLDENAIPLQIGGFSTNNIQGIVTIPNNLQIIGGSCFQDNPSTVSGSLNIPNSVTSVGQYAFLRLTGLNGTFTLGTGATSIGDGFISGTRFSTMTSGETSYWKIENGIVYTKSGGNVTRIVSTPATTSLNLSIFTIPTTVTAIGLYAFLNCTLLTGILTIPQACITLNANAFNGCSNITGLDLPSSITSIGANCFLSCTSMTYLNLQNGYNPAQAGDNWKFNFSNNFTAASLNQSILNIAGGGNTTRTITIGATNKARLLAAYPSAETDANARGITIV